MPFIITLLFIGENHIFNMIIILHDLQYDKKVNKTTVTSLLFFYYLNNMALVIFWYGILINLYFSAMKNEIKVQS